MEKNIIYNFIKSEFPVRKVRNNRNKWSNAIIIPEGYLRKDRKYYPINNKLNKAIITVDITQIVMNIFGCNQEYASKLTIEYLNTITF